MIGNIVDPRIVITLGELSTPKLNMQAVKTIKPVTIKFFYGVNCIPLVVSIEFLIGNTQKGTAKDITNIIAK